MPISIEPVVAPVLDIPAPVVTVLPPSGAAAAGSAPSFQDHLTRARGAGSSASDASTSGAYGDTANERTERSRGDEPGERAETARRDEESDAPTGDATKPASTRSAGAEVKPKRTDEQGKVAEKKKGKPSDEKQEHQDGEAAMDAVVAAVVVADAKPDNEVTLGDEFVATEVAAEALGGVGEKEKKGGVIGAEPTPSTVAAGKPEAVLDVAAQTADIAVNKAVNVAQEPVVLDTDGGKVPVVDMPQMSPMHSMSKVTNERQAPVGADDGTGEAPVSKKSDGTPAEAIVGEAAVGQAAAVADPSVGEKGSDKRESSSPQDGPATFATQLQGAVEAVAAAGAATVAPPTTDVQAATQVATAPTAPQTDAATTGSNSKPTNTQQAAAELVRNASSKDLGVGRAAGDEAGRNGGLSAADRARLVQRVARAVRTAQDRGGELQIRLSPPELGQLRLQIQMTDGVLSARIEAETPQAKQVITENLGMLRDRLAEQNVRVDRIEVDVMNSGSGGSPNMPDRRNDASHDGSAPRGFASNFRNSNRGDAAATEVRTPTATTSVDGRLNVVI